MIEKTISHYCITEEIGRGGMGVVYRAEDTKLKRDVALKFLPEHSAVTEEDRARFSKEAQVAATLNHPNICTIHAIDESDERLFIVMEYVDGVTLRERIAGEPQGLKKDLAVSLGIQIAEALQEAHAKGIVHRDIKSENIMLNARNQAKVMDFGLAKLKGSLRLTKTSSTIGTLSYMSPEQIQGEQADARSDIFSFGVVLYEMLTGRMPFRGEHEAATVYSIVNEDPEPIEKYIPEISAELRHILAKTLEKEPEDRYQSATDLVVDLRRLKKHSSRVSKIRRGQVAGAGEVVAGDQSESMAADAEARDAGGERTVPAPARPGVGRIPPRITLASMVVAGAVIGLVAYHFLLRPSPEPQLKLSFTRLTDMPGSEWFPDISPDGNFIVFTKESTDGKSDIYWQRTGGGNAINITEGSGAENYQPAFSPDGTQIAFHSDRGGGGVFIMGATGESVRRLTDFGYNPAWSPDGKRIVVATESVIGPYSRGTFSQLWVIDVTAGEKEKIFDGDAVQPHWSSGGDRIAFWGLPEGTGQRDIWTVAADGKNIVRVTDDVYVDWCPVWSGDGRYLFFASDRGGSMNLWRVRIDEASGEVLGEPEAVTAPSVFAVFPRVSLSGNRILYASDNTRMNIHKVEFDPVRERFAGLPVPVTGGSKYALTPSASPDGEWIVFREGRTQEDLFLIRPDGKGLRRLTNDIYKDRGPSWSPDGERIVFYSNRPDRYEMWWIRPDGSGLEQLTTTTGNSTFYPHIMPDGSRMLFMSDSNMVQTDLSRPFEEREYESLPVVSESGARFVLSSVSPDGQWLAGHRMRSDDSPIPGIVIYSMERQEYSVIIDRGIIPLWLSDSRRLIFFDSGQMYLVDRTTGRMQDLGFSDEDWTVGEGYSISADNRTLYYSKADVESDIWQATVH
ncbi:MAG: protein kinase [Bacteroidota bacterium]